MPRMIFNTEGCKGVTSDVTGKNYNSDKQGFITVTDHRDVKALKDAGYIVAGGLPRVERWYECDACSWSAIINHCPRCDSSNLRLVEK